MLLLSMLCLLIAQALLCSFYFLLSLLCYCLLLVFASLFDASVRFACQRGATENAAFISSFVASTNATAGECFARTFSHSALLMYRSLLADDSPRHICMLNSRATLTTEVLPGVGMFSASAIDSSVLSCCYSLDLSGTSITGSHPPGNCARYTLAPELVLCSASFTCLVTCLAQCTKRC
jgi:hypothetical protein